jgi:predicted dehydrogenase
VSSPTYFDRALARGGVLMDIGVHLLDLVIWWFGEPVEFRYDDDAMGGIEVNCRLQCIFSSGLVGEIRLSRDCGLANRYLIRGAKGWLSWNVNEADKIAFGLHDSALALDAQLRDRITPGFPLRLGPCSADFHQSFVRQLCNVAAAARKQETLQVPGEEGLRSLRLIERCYRHRSLIPMPWLSQAEVARAVQLSAAL